jgi:hypothetical protein
VQPPVQTGEAAKSWLRIVAEPAAERVARVPRKWWDVPVSETDLRLRRISIKERNHEYYDAAQSCFSLYRESPDPAIAMRAFQNLLASAWSASSAAEMNARLDELVECISEQADELKLTTEDRQLLQAVRLEAEGWLAEPPEPSRFIEAIRILVPAHEIAHALELITSLVAFVEPSLQVHWARYGLQLAQQLPKEERDAYCVFLAEPLILHSAGEEKTKLLREAFERAEALSHVNDRSPRANLALLKGLDMVHPYQIEPERAQQLRQENVDELIRSLANVANNSLRGAMLGAAGSSYYRMAEAERKPEVRRELYRKAKDYFLESVVTMEQTRAYGELLQAYTLAGTGFLSIAELEQDFESRNQCYGLGREYLQKARAIGERTKLYQLRARAAINLGVALERMAWLEFDLERRKEILQEIFNLQLEGREFAGRTKDQRGAGYATMNASEMCGFLSDLETRTDKKQEWATRQRELSLKGLELLEQTQDWRGRVVALSYAAYGCAKLAALRSSTDEKKPVLQEMLTHAERAIAAVDKVPDPVATAYAYQQAGDACRGLGVLTADSAFLGKACEYYEKAAQDWSKTGEPHRQAEALTLLADVQLFRSGLDTRLDETQRDELLHLSQSTHERAALLFTKFLFYHDAGENYWRIGQIHLIRGDFTAAQEVFDKVQKSFDHVAQLVPTLASAYSVFSNLGITFVGLVDGLNLIARGEHHQAVALFEDLASGLADETERNLRHLRQLLEALSAVCQYAATLRNEHADAARTQLARLAAALSPDDYEQQLPYGLHATIRRLEQFLNEPTRFFPPVLMDLPIHENMMAIAQTRYLVNAAMNLYQAAAGEREAVAEEPSEDAIRGYIARISGIVGSR